MASGHPSGAQGSRERSPRAVMPARAWGCPGLGGRLPTRSRFRPGTSRGVSGVGGGSTWNVQARAVKALPGRSPTRTRIVPHRKHWSSVCRVQYLYRTVWISRIEYAGILRLSTVPRDHPCLPRRAGRLVRSSAGCRNLAQQAPPWRSSRSSGHGVEPSRQGHCCLSLTHEPR